MSKKMIDRKFKFVAVNPCNKKVYTEEDAIVFCAKDACVPAMLCGYIEMAEKIGSNKEHIESMSLLLSRVLEYQVDIEKRIPDTETDCEIDRCIGGNV